MLKFLSAIVLTYALLLAPTGCKTASTSTPPAALAPGALNSFDQQAYQTLTAAHAFVSTASAKASTLTPAQTQALNVMIQAVNVAQTVYIAYHSGTETQANVQNALNNVSTAQTTYANSVINTRSYAPPMPTTSRPTITHARYDAPCCEIVIPGAK